MTGLTVCKESFSGGTPTCQASSSCLATSSCTDEEYCSSDDICLAAGTASRILGSIKFNNKRQFIACRMLTVKFWMEPQFANRQLMGEQKLANRQQLVPKIVLQENSVILRMFVNMVCLIFFTLKTKHIIVLVFCSVTSDCSTVTGLTSCKELIAGNPLTCQAPSSCLATTDCSKEEYCTADNICLGAGT